MQLVRSVVVGLVFAVGLSGCTADDAHREEVKQLKAELHALREQMQRLQPKVTVEVEKPLIVKPDKGRVLPPEVFDRLSPRVHLAPPVVALEIEQSLVDELRASAEAFNRGARFVPAFENGAQIGFKLFSIRPASPFANLGLLNADIVLAINGERLTSPDKALAIFKTLQSGNVFNLRLKRRKQEMVYAFTAVPNQADPKAIRYR